MTTKTYDQVLSLTQQLSHTQRLDLFRELVELIHEDIALPQTRSIMELEGLGKEVWAEIDAQAYVEQERDLWD